MTLVLIEFLEKHDIKYIKREIKSYGESGSRVNVPKDWEGNVILIRESTDMSKVLTSAIKELEDAITTCHTMRKLSEDATTACSKVTEAVYTKHKRNNEMCKKCPIGKKIAELTNITMLMYETKEETQARLSGEFYDKTEG